MKGIEEEIVERIKKLEAKNDKIIKTVEEMKKAEVKIQMNNEQQIKDKLVLKEEKMYIPKDKSLRLEIIWLNHNYNMPITEYEGQWKIIELVTRSYWWPEVTKKVK